ncbi:MAG: S1 family peptidase [Archangium sp.]|nr:S1 family peptidase [Archangium sp.]
MLRALTGALVVVVGVACGSSEGPETFSTAEAAIVGGSSDAGLGINDVFLLGMTFSNGTNTICTGTLVSARTLVSAAHCVDPARQGATSVTIRATNKPNDMNLLSSDLIDVTEYRLHPSWNPSMTSATYDIAMVLLARAPVGVTPRPLNRAALTGFVGQSVTLVGYGRTAANTSNGGTRRAVSATVTAVDANSFDFGSAGTLGICAGDSGGAALHQFGDGVVRLVGVHSVTSSAQCGTGSDSRIDFHQTFIDQFIQQRETSSDAGIQPPVDSGVPPPIDAGAPQPVDAGRPDAGRPDAGGPPVMRDGGVIALGDLCLQGQSLCEQGTVCAAPEGFEPICRLPCMTDGGCPTGSHCEAGVGAVTFCRGEAVIPDPTEPDPEPTEPEVSGGCQCQSLDAPLFALVAVLARRRARKHLGPART